MDDYRPHRNEELHQAMMEKRRSNAAQPHEDKRTKRKRSRSDAKRSAIESDQ